MKARLYLFAALLLFVATVDSYSAMGPGRALPQSVLLSDGVSYSSRNFSAMCVACHTENPSSRTAFPSVLPFTDNEAQYRGSHFVYNRLNGSIATRTTNNLGLEKTTLWASTGAYSKYGNTVSRLSVIQATGQMICESCHNIKANTGTNLLVDNYSEATGESDLCIGCHAGPAIGPPNHHPLSQPVGQEDQVGAHGPYITVHNLSTSHVLHDPKAENGFVGYKNNRLTCSSCHRPHDAMTATGAKILRRGQSISTTPGALNKSVNVGYKINIPFNGVAAGVVYPKEVYPTTGEASYTGLYRQFDFDPTLVRKIVINSDPLCESCHK